MKKIDKKLIKKFIEIAHTQLTGEWVLLGGTVLLLTGNNERVTVDIDLVPLKIAESNEYTLRLMRLAEDLGLPPETINQAAGYFLSKIRDFKKHLLPFYKNKKFSLYIPDLYLFIKLKISRLTESDLSDCLNYIDYTVMTKSEIIDESKIIKVINEELKGSINGKKKNLLHLKEYFLKKISHK